MPPQLVHTSPLPAFPLSGLSGPACEGPAEPKRCPQTRTPRCGGTCPSNVHPPPLQAPWPGFEVVQEIVCSQKSWMNPAEKLPKRRRDAWLQWWSTSLRLRAGVSVPLTRSNLRADRRGRRGLGQITLKDSHLLLLDANYKTQAFIFNTHF